MFIFFDFFLFFMFLTNTYNISYFLNVFFLQIFVVFLFIFFKCLKMYITVKSIKTKNVNITKLKNMWNFDKLIKIYKKKIKNNVNLIKFSIDIIDVVSFFMIIVHLKRLRKFVKKIPPLFYLLLRKKKRNSKNFRYSWTGANYMLRSVMSLTKHGIVLIIKLKHYWRKKKAYALIMSRVRGQRFSNLVTKSMKHVEPVMMLKFLVFAMNKVEFVQHRWMLKRLMWQFDYGFDTKYLLSGLTLIVFGKINVGGNARTRTLSYINGIRANSKSWLRGNKYSDTVQTTTGCLGISLAYFL